MKKNFRFMAMAVVAMAATVFTGCSSDDDFLTPYEESAIQTRATPNPDGTTTITFDDFASSMSIYFRIPFSMNINLKATKKIYHDKISCALFVNKILDVSPDYRTNMGILVRRSVLPYFGMELNFKL